MSKCLMKFSLSNDFFSDFLAPNIPTLKSVHLQLGSDQANRHSFNWKGLQRLVDEWDRTAVDERHDWAIICIETQAHSFLKRALRKSIRNFVKEAKVAKSLRCFSNTNWSDPELTCYQDGKTLVLRIT